MRLELGVTTMNLPWNGIAVVSVLVLLQAIPVYSQGRRKEEKQSAGALKSPPEKAASRSLKLTCLSTMCRNATLAERE